MSKPQETQETIAELVAQIAELTARIAVLEERTSPKSTETVEMTDAHAQRILTGDLKGAKHAVAAKTLGLSYGQIYSCRGEYTFKHVHKKLKAAGFKNPWVK